MKKGILLFIFLCMLCLGYSATRTIANGGGNYNSTSTWVEGVVPTSADDVVATSTSGKLVVNVSSAVKTLILTNYIDTLVMNANLSVSGTLTLASGMYYTGSSNLICLTTATLTSNGIVISGGLQLNGTSQTFTLADNWAVNGLFTCAGTTATTINANTITCNGGYTQTTVATVSGTTGFILAGGTWTSTTTSNVLRNNLSFAGDVSLAANVAYNTGTISYTSGAITTSASTLTCVLGTTFNCKAITWNNVAFSGTSQTYTLSDTMDVNGLFTCNGGTAMTINGYAIKLGGGYSQGIPLVNGTTQVVFDDKGTWSGAATNVLKNNIAVNLSDTLTIGTNIAYNTGVFTYLTGVVKTSGSTFTIGETTDLSYGIDSVKWNNVTINCSGGTYTLGRNFEITGILDLANTSPTTALTFSGAYNIRCANFYVRPSGGSFNKTFVLSGDVTCTGTLKVFPNSGWGATLNGGFKINTANIDMADIGVFYPYIGGNTSIVLTGGGTWSGGGGLGLGVTFAGNTIISGAVSSVNLTYSSGTISTAGSTMVSSGNATLNTAGITWENFTFKNLNGIVTLTSDMDVNGTLTIAAVGSPANITLNGYSIRCWSFNYSYPTNRAFVLGTTNIIMDGTGTLQGATIGGASLNNNLTFNTTGTITGTGDINVGNGTITYVSGTMNMAGSTLRSTNSVGFCTLNTSGMTWGNVYFYLPFALASDCNIAGLATVNSAGYYGGAYTFKCSGDLLFNYNSIVYNMTGPAKWLMNGKGTLSTAATTNFEGDLTINTADTVTLGTYFNLEGAFTYTAGTIVSTGSTFQTMTNSGLTINGPGFNMDSYVAGTSQTFGGSHGFTTKNFTCNSPGSVLTFTAGKTYSITNSVIVAGTSASRVSFVSSTSGTQATVTLSEAATEDIAFANATDIKSDLGQRFWTYKGVINNSPGWLPLPTEPRTVSYTF